MRNGAELYGPDYGPGWSTGSVGPTGLAGPTGPAGPAAPTGWLAGPAASVPDRRAVNSVSTCALQAISMASALVPPCPGSVAST
ncbi:hypothetical protein DNK48_19990 [Streptomyces malaysiensis subsp. malaysiensis]|nr:hypothetical protein DNK48_19990 [Streptomyces malaysiensis]